MSGDSKASRIANLDNGNYWPNRSGRKFWDPHHRSSIAKERTCSFGFNGQLNRNDTKPKSQVRILFSYSSPKTAWITLMAPLDVQTQMSVAASQSHVQSRNLMRCGMIPGCSPPGIAALPGVTRVTPADRFGSLMIK